ncbi:hypothetical protein Q8A73_015889 [Channa argus]|nr:hypothetical protein Q8A73_015889 [Channa argus]
MSSIQLLRVLVNERLSTAAEEIFEAVKKTIAGYEEELLLSKREIRRQHQPALSVWDEDFPSDQQQPKVHGEHQGNKEPRQTEKNQEVLPSSQEEEQLQELEEDDTIIFTPPYVKNELDQLQSSYQSTKGGGDPLPSTSAKQDQTKVEGDDGASMSSSEPECDNSDEEWRGSVGSQSDDSDSEGKWKKKKKKRPCLPMAPKLHPTKNSKSRICCKVCGKGFHANVSLVNHMEVHPKDVCGVCGDRFENEESFKVHLKKHVKAEICSICGKCFGASSSLETHMRIHTGEKPFNCSECGKSFNCRHNMMRHIRIHTGEKPYPCTVCGKCFNDYSTLKRHLMVHVHKKNLKPKKTSANDSEISSCIEKQIKTSSTKKQQTRTICEVCGKMFHSMVSLGYEDVSLLLWMRSGNSMPNHGVTGWQELIPMPVLY